VKREMVMAFEYHDPIIKGWQIAVIVLFDHHISKRNIWFEISPPSLRLVFIHSAKKQLHLYAHYPMAMPLHSMIRLIVPKF